VGINLLDESTWPSRREEDLAWVRTLEAFATPEHVERLLQEVSAGAIRLRPQEVLGACTCATLPADFATAARGGSTVLEMLASA
jgi:hypothetical protein